MAERSVAITLESTSVEHRATRDAAPDENRNGNSKQDHRERHNQQLLLHAGDSTPRTLGGILCRVFDAPEAPKWDLRQTSQMIRPIWILAIQQHGPLQRHLLLRLGKVSGLELRADPER